jgi:hypothetical protein
MLIKMGNEEKKYKIIKAKPVIDQICDVQIGPRGIFIAPAHYNVDDQGRISYKQQ